MVEANVQIIGELKRFLEEVSTNAELKKIFTENETDFSRDRILTLKRIVGIIINMPKRSLSIEIREFLHSLSGEESCTKSAFCLQRSKLKPIFFQVWNTFLVSLFYHYYGEKVLRWRNYLIYSVDGSTAYLPNTDEIVEYFGTQSNQHVSVPMARVMQIYDVLNDINVWGDIYPIKESEQHIMSHQVEELPEDSITLFDRGYPSFALIYLMLHQERERLFVMRCKAGFNKEVKAFMTSDATDTITYFTATDDAKRILYGHGFIISDQTKVKVRLVKIKLSSGETEVLITNLYDKVLYTDEDLSYLYFLRWGIETNYGKEKNQLQLEQFSGHRVLCIKQDYHATLFVANLQSLIEKQSKAYLNAVSKQRKYRYKINKNVSWAALKNNLFKLFLMENAEQILMYLQHVFEQCLEPVRPNRSHERVKKSKRLHGKYQTLTNYKRAI